MHASAAQEAALVKSSWRGAIAHRIERIVPPSMRMAMPLSAGDAAKCRTLQATSSGSIMRRINEVGSVSSK
jgi:hypothetical protein